MFIRNVDDLKAHSKFRMSPFIVAGIAVCNTPGDCVEEVADTTMSLILNMYRKTFWLAKAVSEGKKVFNHFQLILEALHC